MTQMGECASLGRLRDICSTVLGPSRVYLGTSSKRRLAGAAFWAAPWDCSVARLWRWDSI